MAAVEVLSEPEPKASPVPPKPKEVAALTGVPDSQTDDGSLIARRHWIPKLRWLLSAACFGLAGLMGLWFWHRHLPIDPPIRSIAVLPLENLSGDPEQEYFSDGMTDALITDLAQISSLKVISRTSVMRYKGTRKPLPDIAKELNVDGIVEGTVIRTPEKDGIRGAIEAAKEALAATPGSWGAKSPSTATRSKSRA